MLGEAAIGIRRSRRPARAERAGASESAAGLRSETTSVVENQSGAVVQQRRRRDLAVDTIIPKPIFRFLISALYAFSAVTTNASRPRRTWMQLHVASASPYGTFSVFPVVRVFRVFRGLTSPSPRLRVNLSSFFLFVLLLAVRVPAADPVNYRIGDQITEDVATPVALDVIDPTATASLKFAEALKTPAIFDYYPDTAGIVGKRFQQVAAEAHSNFIAAVESTFHSPKVGDEVINSADFGYLVTAFNIKSRVFPVTTDLAAEWAHGNDGQAILDHSLQALRQASGQFVRADELPDQFSIGETLRLVPMTVGRVTPVRAVALTPEEAMQRGKLTIESTVLTLTQAQNQLRKQFPNDQQPFAQALAALLSPNCVADVELTEMVRSNATRHFMVAQHYDAGQIIVHKNDIVDARMKAALDALSDRLTSSLLRQQIAAERARAGQEAEAPSPIPMGEGGHRPGEGIDLAMQAGKLAREAHDEAGQARGESAAILAQVRTDHRNLWLITLVGGATITILGVFSWVVYRRTNQVGRVTPVRAVVARVSPLNQIELSSNASPLVPSPLGGERVRVRGERVSSFEGGHSPGEDPSPILMGEGGRRPGEGRDLDLAAIAPHVARAVHDAVMQEMGLQRRELMLAQQTATDEIARLVDRLEKIGPSPTDPSPIPMGEGGRRPGEGRDPSFTSDSAGRVTPVRAAVAGISPVDPTQSRTISDDPIPLAIADEGIDLQERLKAYEDEIERLENLLIVRTQENREMLKAKVEMMRQHLDYERARTSDSWQVINGGMSGEMSKPDNFTAKRI